MPTRPPTLVPEEGIEVPLAEDVLVLLGVGAGSLVGVEHHLAAVVQLRVEVAGAVVQAQVVEVAVGRVGQGLADVGALGVGAAAGGGGGRVSRRVGGWVRGWARGPGRWFTRW